MSYWPFVRCRWLRSVKTSTPSIEGVSAGLAADAPPEQPLSTSRVAKASSAPRGPESTLTTLVWPGESPPRPDRGAAGGGLQQRDEHCGAHGLACTGLPHVLPDGRRHPDALSLAVTVTVTVTADRRRVAVE